MNGYMMVPWRFHGQFDADSHLKNYRTFQCLCLAGIWRIVAERSVKQTCSKHENLHGNHQNYISVNPAKYHTQVGFKKFGFILFLMRIVNLKVYFIN